MKITYRFTRSYLLFTTAVLLTALTIPVKAEESSADLKSPTVNVKDENRDSNKVLKTDPVDNLENAKTNSLAADSTNEHQSQNSDSSSQETAPSADKQNKNSDQNPHKKADIISLKAGEKLKIAGFAENQEPSIAKEAISSSQPTLNRVQMRISGSMCYACLHDFQERLKRIFGVERARVEKSTQVTIQSFSPDLSNWAEAIIFYDSKALELADLRAFMKANGYFSYKVLVKQVDQLPAEDQKKI